MLVFNIGIKILLAATVIFFLVFFYLCFLWSGMHSKGERFFISLATTFLYSFIIFTVGVLVVAVISLAWQYLPGLF